MKKLIVILLTVLLVCSFVLVGCSTSTSVVTSTATATTTATSTAVTTATTTATKVVQPVTIRFGTPGPAEHPGTLAMIDWANKFNAATGGAYEMKVIPGGVLAASLDQMNAIRTGAEDMGDAATNFYAGDDPAFSVMDVPFTFNNLDAQAAFGAAAVPIFDAISVKKFNQKIITYFVYGKKDLYTVSKEVKTIADWKGLLVSINSQLESDTVKAFGAAPVLVDFVDELPDLQKGVINAGCISSLAGLAPMGYADVIKYLTVANMKGGLGFFAINLDVWNSMPKNIQDIMVSTSKDFTTSINQVFKDGELNTYIGMLEKGGVTVYNLPSAERANWINLTKPIADAYWASLPSDVANVLQNAITSANSKFPAQ